MSPKPASCRLVLSDVDGTLLDSRKRLTSRAVRAVDALRHAGIEFAITSGRPPRGMSMLTGPLDLTTPLAAFNGGAIVTADMSVKRLSPIPTRMVEPSIAIMSRQSLDVWVYTATEWYVRDEDGPHVDRESNTVGFGPMVLESYDEISEPVIKIVGVSDAPGDIMRAESALKDELGAGVSAARSQPYYVDVTNVEANKGSFVGYLSRELGVPPASIVTIGDMPNDVLMFDGSGISIAMGNAGDEVKRRAQHVTTSNDDEGFARAIETFVLGHAEDETPYPPEETVALTVGVSRPMSGQTRRSS